MHCFWRVAATHARTCRRLRHQWLATGSIFLATIRIARGLRWTAPRRGLYFDACRRRERCDFPFGHARRRAAYRSGIVSASTPRVRPALRTGATSHGAGAAHAGLRGRPSRSRFVQLSLSASSPGDSTSLAGKLRSTIACRKAAAFSKALSEAPTTPST